MPSSTTEPITWEAERTELQAVLRSALFVRSPTLTHLLSYLCDKAFAGEIDKIKEYSVALDVFRRPDSFDQETDSIVRVQANRLRKRLREYYAVEGASHPIQITIPVGQYVPIFHRTAETRTPPVQPGDSLPPDLPAYTLNRPHWIAWSVIAVVIVLLGFALTRRGRQESAPPSTLHNAQPAAEAPVGLPVGDEVHILAGSNRKYVDHAGKIWSPDADFSGGYAVSSAVRHIWRTQDPFIYRSSRQGDFSYNIPLKSGTYELRLHFAETFYGPENAGGGGEGSRTMTVLANGRALLHDYDVLADAEDARTAEIKIFPDISPADDGQVHLSFIAGKSKSAMVSAIEILPAVRGKPRPIRIVARDIPYYSNDSRWWSPDTFFKGGQLSSSQEPAMGTDDPEFYETERWGHFSYAIPVPPGRYTVTLYFIDHGMWQEVAEPIAGGISGSTSQNRVFSVFCNGKTIVADLDIIAEAGKNHPLVRKIRGLMPNPQGKLRLEFVPVTRYATVSAIEVMQE